jgi:hypothetical protein
MSTIYGADVHPPTLTQTERLRVIRACYQIWKLSRQRGDEVVTSVCNLRPRELFYFSELLDWVRLNMPPSHNDVHNRNWNCEDDWDLSQVYEGMDKAMHSLYGHADLPPNLTGYWTGNDLFVIWDHWQENLWNLVTREPSRDIAWDEKDRAWHADLWWEEDGWTYDDLWDFEPGDDLLLSDWDFELEDDQFPADFEPDDELPPAD